MTAIDLDTLDDLLFDEAAYTPAPAPAPLSEQDSNAVEYIGLLVSGIVQRNCKAADQQHVQAVADHIMALVQPEYLQHLVNLAQHNCIHTTGAPRPRLEDFLEDLE